MEKETELERGKPPLWIGLAVFFSLICLIIYFGLITKLWLEDEQRMPVQNVIFSGERLILNDLELEALIRKSQKGSFFALDVNQVHQQLESLPWVYRASVRKRWPSSLHIYLVEEKASAIWNDDLLLNEYGEPFDGLSEYISVDSESLPMLFGPGGSERTALAGLKAMQTILNGTELRVRQLFLSERFAWQVRLDNNIQLKLGRKEFIGRLQRFIDIYPLLKAQNKKINYIDLRYDIGLAVGWGQEQEAG